ncbi:enoyl-CoA hydratase/isomerase family protein [Streptomyces sp. NPDC056500]|uniref:enoyl-CoA hydratase/isomerase family protein n=1 Tax=Streptomyces sp. NPDC056500 TaxID=3345840 RepID=UPI0036BBACD9
MGSDPTGHPSLRIEEVDPGVTLVTLARPERRNALDTTTLDELARALDALDARAVVLTGNGPAFCAGYDLRSIAGPHWEQSAEQLVAHPRHAVFDVMERSAFPIIAAIDGATLGGGLELASCCDARVATRSAYFAIPAGDLGLVYSDTGVRRFASVWGGSLTREMLLLGRRVDADRAWQAGAIAELTPDGTHVETALQLARRAARLAPRATASNKRIIGGTLTLTPAPAPAGPSLDADALRQACFGPDGELRAGIDAFLRGRAVRPIDDTRRTP